MFPIPKNSDASAALETFLSASDPLDFPYIPLCMHSRMLCIFLFFFFNTPTSTLAHLGRRNWTFRSPATHLSARTILIEESV
jgi:hypothetical protein